MGRDETPPDLDFARRAHADVRQWYTSADNKAQILLTLDGVIVATSANALIGERAESVVQRFGPETWLFVLLAAIALLSSLFFAIQCLWSRKWEPSDLQLGQMPTNEEIWFFGAIATATERPKYIEKLRTVTQSDEVEVMGHQIHRLSVNVTRKHTAVRASFVALGLCLGALTLATASYVVRLS